MSKTYVSGIGGSGKAHFLFKRILDKLSLLSSEGVNPNLRVFAFVKDEELSSFADDLKTFFQMQSEEWRVRNEELKAMKN